MELWSKLVEMSHQTCHHTHSNNNYYYYFIIKLCYYLCYSYYYYTVGSLPWYAHIILSRLTNDSHPDSFNWNLIIICASNSLNNWPQVDDDKAEILLVQDGVFNVYLGDRCKNVYCIIRPNLPRSA